jgi:hypothetical protein
MTRTRSKDEAKPRRRGAKSTEGGDHEEDDGWESTASQVCVLFPSLGIFFYIIEVAHDNRLFPVPEHDAQHRN